MSNMTAVVNSRSWTLEVTGAWPASAVEFGGDDTAEHPDFALDPNGTPKVVLTVTGSGFTRSGGQAVPANWTRTIVATKPLRKPFSPSGPPAGSLINNIVLNEVDNGNGTRTVWLALSEPIYAGETATVSFSDGWRVGQTAVADVPVTNNSNRAYPLPVTRWATPQRVPVIGTSTVRVDAVVASHFPRHFGSSLHQAVAAVKFEVTDTTTTKTFWVTEDSVSPLYNDGLLCWGATLDLSGLNPGAVQVRYTVYPWLGVPRTMGTTLMTNNGQAEVLVSNDITLLLGYDPNDTFFSRRYIYVDPVNGTQVNGDITIGTSLAAAKAGTAAATISHAIGRLRNINFNLPAANGFPSATFAAPYWEIVLAPGVNQLGTQTIFAFDGAGALGHLVIRGDPDDPNPRANCIVRRQAGIPTMRAIRYRFEDCTLQLGNGPLFAQGYINVWLNRVNIRALPGATSRNQFFQTNAIPANTVNIWATDFDHQEYDPLGSSGQTLPMLLRSGTVNNSVGARGTTGVALINLTAVPNPAVTYGSGQAQDFNLSGGAGGDGIAWGIKALHNSGSALLMPGSAGAGTEANPTISSRTAIVNCVFARSTPNTDQPFMQIGEGSYQWAQDCIVEGNTFVASRVNWHNDPPNPDADHKHINNRVANNYWDWQPTKHEFLNPASPNRTGSWELLYGVQHKGNVHADRVGGSASNFVRSFYGVGTYRQTAPFPGAGAAGAGVFVEDNSNFGPNRVAGVGPGGGDYRPGVGSQLRGRGVVANTRQDAKGVLRGLTFSSGALEAQRQAGQSLAPAAAVHALVGVAPHVRADARLRVSAARHAVVGVAPALRIDAWLRVSGARHPMVATTPELEASGSPGQPILNKRILKVPAEPRIVRADGE